MELNKMTPSERCEKIFAIFKENGEDISETVKVSGCSSTVVENCVGIMKHLDPDLIPLLDLKICRLTLTTAFNLIKYIKKEKHSEVYENIKILPNDEMKRNALIMMSKKVHENVSEIVDEVYRAKFEERRKQTPTVPFVIDDEGEFVLIPKNLYSDIVKMIEPKKHKFIFDTETTGLPSSFSKPQYTFNYDCARLIEIAYIIIDEEKNVMAEKSFLIIPDNFVINNSHIHGITTEMCVIGGVPIREALLEVEKDLGVCDTIVAHNLKFDENILLSECYRYKIASLIDVIEEKKKTCTMEMGKIYMKSQKNPKLTELYKHIFEQDFAQEHRAMSDTVACKDCYLQMF
jgi:DNA polymerase III subunit epsilon